MRQKPLAVLLSWLVLTLPILIAQEIAAPQQELQDTEPPQLQYFTIFPEATSTNPVEFSYEAYDYGQKGDTSKCSGIKKVEFAVKETGQAIATREGAQEDCIIEESFKYTPAQEGEQTVCAAAHDYAGKKSEEKCAKLNVVKQAPAPEKIEFYDKNLPLKYTSKNGAVLDLKLFFKNINLVDAVQTKINVDKLTGKQEDWKSPNIEGNALSIQQINIKPDFQCRLTPSITDVFGNKAEKEINCDLQIDADQPVPIEIKTGLRDIEGAYLVNTQSKTKITALIEEKGVGFGSNKNVYLDLSQITNNAKAQADTCEQKNELWECTWEVTATAKKGNYVAALLDTSEDDLGNKFAKKLKQDIDVTDEALEIFDVQYAPEFPTEEDELVIMASIPAAIAQPTVNIDASAITKNKQKTSADCNKDGTALRCTARIRNLQSVGKPEDVTITMADIRGNTLKATKKIQVFEAEPKTKDFFNFGGVIIRPSQGIDRRTATITEHPISASLRWNQKAGAKNLQIISQTINCEEKYLATPPETIGQESKSPTIFFKTTTDVADIKEDSIQIPCTANLMIKKDKVVFKQPETKTFTLTIPLYNNPLGSIDETVQKKISDVNAEIKEFEDSTREWENVNRALGKMVGISQMIAQLDAMMAGAVAAALLLAQIVAAVAGGINGGDNAWYGPCMAYTISSFIIKGGVWSPGYFPFLQTLYTPLKLASFIYSCQMCRHTGKISIPFLGATGDIVAHTNVGNLVKGKQTFVGAKVLNEWDPKKSIHVAQNCYCPNAIEYNLRKEQQLKCIYRNCIKEHAKKGLPLADCDKTFKEQNCLYVDSAAWKIAGGAGLASLMQKMLADLIRNLPVATSGIAWTGFCDPLLGYFGVAYGEALAYWGGCQPVAAGGPGFAGGGPIVVGCAIWGGIQELAETEFFSKNQFDWDKYDGELRGNDYCATEE